MPSSYYCPICPTVYSLAPHPSGHPAAEKSHSSRQLHMMFIAAGVAITKVLQDEGLSRHRRHERRHPSPL